MENEFQWEGHTISIDTRPVMKYLLLATETIATVDGIEIGRSGGFRINEILTGNFSHNGKTSELVIEIKADLITLVSVPYKLLIDGNLISEGRLKINNWALSIIPLFILVSVLCCFCSMISIISSLFN